MHYRSDNIKEKMIQLKDGDGIRITTETMFYLTCCNCNLKHEVHVEKRKKEIILKFQRINEK